MTANPASSATMDLLRRTRRVLAMAWRTRHDAEPPKRRADELAFLPSALSLVETPPHPAPRRLALALCAFFVLAVAWAWWGQLDIVAVAQGRVVVTDGTKLVQPLEAGVVKAIHVANGDKVTAGQLLIELDGTAPQADSARLTQERHAMVSESLRTRALIQAMSTGRAPELPNHSAPTGLDGGNPNPESGLDASAWPAARAQLASEWADLQAQKSRLEAEAERRSAEALTIEQQIAKVQATLPLARQREADFQALSQQGFVAGHAGQDRTRERIELERDLATLRAKHREAQAARHEAHQQAKAWAAEAVRQLEDRRAKADLGMAQLHQETAKAQLRQRQTQLTAPVDGTVQQLSVHTAGGVVTPAQALLVVVPDKAQVTAEVLLENKDVGFVKLGQQAEIKVESLPYTRWGTVPATVTRLTADAVADERRGAVFPVTLTLSRAAMTLDGQAVALSPGMNLTAEIMTGKRTVMDYLFSPVVQRVGESLRER